MSLDLDQRQRAMLQEMGVRVWLPEAVADVAFAAEVAGSEEETETAAAFAIEIIAIEAINTGATASKASESRVPDRRELAPPVAPAVAPAGLPDGIAGMDWPTLAQTVASCQACALRTGRRAPVFGAADADAEAPRQADWLVVGEPPDEAEERLGAPFADQAGQLLDNMLKALGVSRRGGSSRASAAYVTNVVKCRPAVVRNPEAQELAACENYLRREVALVQPKVILAMGRFAAQALLQGSLPEVASIPLGKLRGQIYRYHGIPVVVSYHPGYLLRTQQDKARAWADLCLALELTQ
ncbi:uracil-DNA glycosylase [Rhodoferax sp.]|uniref:uracil-DNA glycosylase n=1 Tax=Rhodoferax sp. TaxID=50421 RepID=UPI0027281CC8|nr:uracil-DNA glycosylase [Rhodoferax sp.]MDO9198553.1 uracil-DNA glycosylase [Rhodoferax sp.]